MKFYSTSLPDVTPIKIVTAKSTYGIGLLTSIVKFFCNLIGRPCRMYTEKIHKAQKLAMDDLELFAIEMGADGVMDVHCQVDGLSFLVYGTAYKTSNKKYKQEDYKESKAKEKSPKRQKDLPEDTFDVDCNKIVEDSKYMHIKCSNCREHLSFLKDDSSMICPYCNTEVDYKKPIVLHSMDKPADFVYRKSWDEEIGELPIDEVYKRYLDEERWNESYRYLCYLELKERGN